MLCVAPLRGFYKVGLPNFSGGQFFCAVTPGGRKDRAKPGFPLRRPSICLGGSGLVGFDSG